MKRRATLRTTAASVGIQPARSNGGARWAKQQPGTVRRRGGHYSCLPEAAGVRDTGARW
ncbi:MAG TPA: hypothetical protein VE673_06510 [Pseudonocardiaceae bacterium]|nr:hypothetical protein [Pseudonocardiaceae bacterium]